MRQGQRQGGFGNLRRGGLGLALVSGFLLAAPSAHAFTVGNIGGIICNFAQQNSAWPVFVSWIAYITGTFFIARGLLLLKLHSDDAARMPISKPVLHLLMGAAGLVFPSFVQMWFRTVHASAGTAAGGVLACTPGAVTPPGAGIGLDVLASNFVNNITQPVFFFGGWVCYCLGAWFIYRGLNKMAKYNTDPKHYAPQIILANFVIGALLMWIGRAKGMIMASIFGVDVNDRLGFAGTSGYLGAGPGNWGLIDWAALGVTGVTTQFDTAFIAALTFFQLVGFIAFIRGWLIAKAHVEGVGNHTMGQALTHIIGGAVCMNIVLFLQAAEWTFGVNFLI